MSAKKTSSKAAPVRDTSAPAEKPKPAGIEPARRRACPATHSKKRAKRKAERGSKSCRAKTRTAPPLRRPRMKLADAMREEGVDESKVAQTMAGLIDGLASKPRSEKLLLDAVKESIRVLEPSKTTVRTGASDGPVTVILEHSVPRPDRQPPA